MKLTDYKHITQHNACAAKKDVLAAAEQADSVLDFSCVESVDSSAVALLLAWVRVVRRQGRTPEIVDMPVKMIALLQLYGIFPVVESFVVSRRA